MDDANAFAEELVRRARISGTFDAEGVMLDLRSDADTLLISCAGIVPHKVMYGMVAISRVIPAKKLFICDESSSWYYNGIKGLTASFDQTIDAVAAVVRVLRPKRLCTVGTSGGGYMALALAAKLHADRALAFCPQTTISRSWRERHGETRWPEQMARIHDSVGGETPYSIRTLMEAASVAKPTQYHLIVSEDCAPDVDYAGLIEDRPGVHTYFEEGSEHNVAGVLRRNGKLFHVLDAFVRSADADVQAGLSRALGSRPATAADDHRGAEYSDNISR